MATRRLVTARGALALVLSFCLASVPALTAVPAAQAAGEEIGHGSIHGTLYQPDEKGPLAGGKVTAINMRTGKQYTSNVTTENGNYDINGLPAGTYDVVIEVGGNLFVADHVQDVGPGESASKSYSVQPSRPANRVIPKLPAPKGSATIVGETVAQAPFWTSTGGKVLIGVLAAGAAAAIYNATKSNKASPSSP
jgi:hypothetical protein